MSGMVSNMTQLREEANKEQQRKTHKQDHSAILLLPAIILVSFFSVSSHRLSIAKS